MGKSVNIVESLEKKLQSAKESKILEPILSLGLFNYHNEKTMARLFTALKSERDITMRMCKTHKPETLSYDFSEIDSEIINIMTLGKSNIDKKEYADVYKQSVTFMQQSQERSLYETLSK